MKLATWNVQHSTSPVDVVAAVRSLIEQHELDAVCLQELTPLSIVPPHRSVHRALARSTGWNAVLAIHPRPYPGWIEAVGIFTPLSIVRERRALLSPNRAYVEAIVRDAHVGAVCIGSIHLSSPGWRRRELRRAIAAAPERRYVLAGDFNLSATDAILAETLPRYTSDGLDGVDHVYLTPDLRMVHREVVRTAPSDHDAVLATIETRT